jgi:hypothetical protein
MNLDVDGAAALPLDHLDLAIATITLITESLMWNSYTSCTSKKGAPTRRQTFHGGTAIPGGTKRFGTLSKKVGCKDSNTPGREGSSWAGSNPVPVADASVFPIHLSASTT